MEENERWERSGVTWRKREEEARSAAANAAK